VNSSVVRLRRRDAGHATALALIATLMMSALAAGLASTSYRLNETGISLDNNVSASYAAEAGLEQVKAAISSSEYTLADGNLWLSLNALPFDANRREFPAASDAPVFADLQVGEPGKDREDIRVDVWVYAMDAVARKYRAVSRGRTGSVEALLAQDIRARDSFARFATFVDEGTLRFGASNVRGDVHSNDRIEFHYGGAQFHDRVSATAGFDFQNGATEGNTSFRDQNRFGARINLPTVTDVNAFGEFSEGKYNVRSSNPDYAAPGDVLDARIRLMGDQVQITAVSRNTGSVVSDATLPVPADGVIYVEGNVMAIEGTLSGRMTISTPGQINVTGNIVYADGSGNKAMRLEDADGQAIDPATLPADASWSADGRRYAPNPDFSASEESRPSLGLMAGQQIKLDGAGPRDLEVHAALFSAASNWTADLEVPKGNLRILGSITTKKPGARAQGSMGYAASGEYVYDASLLDNPPPRWLQVDSPFWGPRWRMGW
jgi:hypothetical protein